MKRAFIAIASIAAGAPLLLWAAWMIAIPQGAIEKAANAPLAAQGLGIEFKGLGKGLFFGVHADGLDITKNGSPVVSIEDASAQLRLGSLIPFKPAADLRARMAEGSLTGTLLLIERYLYIAAELRDAELSGLGQTLDRVGIRGRGRLNANIQIDPKLTGIEFSVGDALLEPMDTAQGMIPLDMFRTVRGSLNITDRAVEVKSITLEGKDIYAKASGTVTRIGMDLKLELMPKAGSSNEIALDSLFKRYKTGPGHYVIPVKGALNR